MTENEKGRCRGVGESISREEFYARLHKTNPEIWAGFLLDNLRAKCAKIHDMTGELHLEVAENRLALAEAVNIAQEAMRGKIILGISNGTQSGFSARCKLDEKAELLEIIGEQINENTRYVLVLTSELADARDIGFIRRSDTQDAADETL